MPIVQVSYVKLLEEISGKLGIQAPQCEVSLVGGEWFLACIEFSVVRVGSAVETQHCWGGPSRNMQEAKEEASCFAIRKMMAKFDLEIKDINYEDYILFKAMYNEVTIQYANLLADFNQLGYEYNMLKNCYASTVNQNADFVARQVKMQSIIDGYHATINRLRRDCSVSSVEPSEDTSNS